MELRWPGWLTRRPRMGRLSRLNPSAFQNSTLAELAWQRLQAGHTDEVATLEPIYLGQPVRAKIEN